MNPSNDLPEQITRLVEAYCHKLSTFETFAKEIAALGLDRLTYNSFSNKMAFYIKDKFVYALERQDLTAAREKGSWVLGEKLDITQLENAIKQLDAGKIDTTEFHREIFNAGVVFCNVFLDLRKIYYLAQDGQHYLENY